MELQCVVVLHLYYLLFSFVNSQVGSSNWCRGAWVAMNYQKDLQWGTGPGNIWHQRSNRWWWITKVSRLLLHQKHPALQVGTFSQKIMCSNWFTGWEGKKLCLLVCWRRCLFYIVFSHVFVSNCVRWFNFARVHSFRCMLIFAGSIFNIGLAASIMY